ncbi:GTPase, G3E family [Salinihabitans flavidus]|uniref:GTPase, G3E family n=1 Tax=Salinihabitans flavidus TaxID=569882 RepID=A0A1H8VMU0_9RHOB|nr:GTP-binding protein [Salinihabitans flavidus]SEP16715.1 GTPase, G3E family [Salinihabitans flavidus]
MIPLTLLTGFLGAGKTTLLNRVLSESHGSRMAVIVNEFGEVGIDGTLVEGAQGGVVELANGCLCCATRGQLLVAIHAVLQVAPPPDAILIETSGLADPFPVLSELAHSSLVEAVQVDGVITVVDAENFDRNLDSAEAAFQQITAADILLVNKTDLVELDIPGLIERGIRVLNPSARVLPCISGDVPLSVLIGARTSEKPLPTETKHGHDNFESTVLDASLPFDPKRLEKWLGALPCDVFRTKGFVRVTPHRNRVTVSAVGTRYWLSPAESSNAVDRLIVIGQNLDRAKLQAGLDACRE